LPTFACPAFGTMNTNALIGLVLKNPEVRHWSRSFLRNVFR
jgi:hypothetical protein